jgi:hypothetical protein
MELAKDKGKYRIEKLYAKNAYQHAFVRLEYLHMV